MRPNADTTLEKAFAHRKADLDKNLALLLNAHVYLVVSRLTNILFPMLFPITI